jgi:hypothetical protein
MLNAVPSVKITSWIAIYMEVDIVHIILSDNLHYVLLKPFGVTEDSAVLADVHHAVSLCPHVSVHCTVNIRFLRIMLEEGARNVCLRRADTRHF